jgi:mannose-1-phosphate guanylyltransferase
VQGDDAAVRHAVILAGGAGTRLWPASRRSRPKQFLALGGDETLLAATVRRARGAATGDVVVVTAADQVDLVRAGAPGVSIVAEPVARNTAAALGLAAVHLLARDPDAVIGAMPADHHIADEAGWARVVERAFAVAERGDATCTIGIVPTRADTGFGYLELGASREAELGVPGVRAVARFVEKPDAETAAGYLAGGRHLWNAGMFFVRARRLLDDIGRFLPATAAGLDVVAAALKEGPAAAAAEAARIYPGLPAVSIDHGVMEKASPVLTVPGDFGWSDIGSWAALAELRTSADGGNTVIGDGVIVDGEGNLVVAEDGVIAVVGCSDLVVVRSGDAVLVIPRARSQDVRRAVEALTARHLERFL